MAHLFGAKLRYLRRQRELTQVEIAQQLSSRSHLAGIELGKETPSLRLVLRAAQFFAVSTDYMLRDTIAVEEIRDSIGTSSGDDLLPKQFGAKLRYLRRRHQLTQGALATALGLSKHAYISNLEAGRKAPSLDLIVQIANFFGVTTDYLLLDSIPLEQST